MCVHVRNPTGLAYLETKTAIDFPSYSEHWFSREVFPTCLLLPLSFLTRGTFTPLINIKTRGEVGGAVNVVKHITFSCIQLPVPTVTAQNESVGSS